MKPVECGGELFPERANVSHFISFLIGHFKSTTKVEESERGEILGDAEKNIGHLHKDIHLNYLGAGVDMKSTDGNLILCHQSPDVIKLRNGNAKLGIAVTC